jgi:NTE family protein
MRATFVVLATLAWFLALPAAATEVSAPAEPEPAPIEPEQAPPVAPAHPARIGLVLGGGGARGVAHIGVLKVLERERIPIAYVTGTSMGGVIGSLYAAGYSPDEMEAIILAIDWRAMLDDDPPRIDLPMRRKDETLRFLLDYKLGFKDGAIQLPRGAIEGQKMLLLLRRLLLPTWRVASFDALPIPFRCVATDIVNGDVVVFREGDLALAVRASMSVPAAFAPIRVDGRLVVDGGLVNNVPYDVVKGMGASRVIAIDVGTPAMDEQDLNSPIAITMQMITLVTQKLTDEILATMSPEDLLIKPDLGDITSGSFDRSAEAIPLGEHAAEALVAQLRRYSVGEAEYAAWRASIRRRAFDPPLVEFVDTITRRSTTAGYVDRVVSVNEGKPLEVDRLERDIGEAYGAGPYERIVWNLKTDEQGRTGVEVLPVDKGWGPGFFTFGLQISDDFEGRSDYQLATEYTQSGLNRWGLEWRTTLGIGRFTVLRSELYQPIGEAAQFFTEQYVDYRATQQPLTVASAELAEYRISRSRVGADIGWNPNQNNRLTLGVLYGHDDADLKIGDPATFGDFDADVGALRLGFTHDTLDDAEFPAHGTRLDIGFESYQDTLGSDSEGEVLRINADWALSRDRDHLLLGARGTTFYGQEVALSATGFLGGFTNLSGYTERELFGSHSLLGRAVYYRRLNDNTKLFSVPTYVGGSFEAGNVYDSRDQVDLDSLIFAGSLFLGVDTIFGPVFLGYGHADSGEHSWYLTFGSLLRPQL